MWRLICFRRGPDTRTAVFPVRPAHLYRVRKCVRQLDRIRQYPEVHGITVKSAALAADVEAITPRVLHCHVNQDQRLVDCARDVDPVFQPLVVECPVPGHRCGQRHRGALVDLLQLVQIANARWEQHLHYGLGAGEVAHLVSDDNMESAAIRLSGIFD